MLFRAGFTALLSVLVAFPVVGSAQTPPPPASRLYVIRAAHMIDGRSDVVRDNVAVVVDGERIVAVGSPAEVSQRIPAGAQVIDLGGSTILPGLIDNHTHVLLQGDITSADYDEQLLRESIPYRAIRATAAVRASLMNGFTAIRDLETEGAMYADVDVKTAIARGIIPGPRMFVSTRALSTTGTYPLLGYSWELKMPEGVQIVDGPEDIRKAVREEAKYGADWIKFYADRRYFVAADGRLRSWVNFTDEELKMLVAEAHRLGKKVAAHAMGWDGIDAALRAGVNSIEHGDGLTDDLLDRMVAQKVYWCPTIFVGVYVAPGRGGIWPKMVDLERIAFGKALKKGVMISYGTDAGGYAWSENQAQEFAYMVRYGMSPMAAIKSATSVAAQLLDQSENFGTVDAGKLADIIAVKGDPIADISELSRVSFVMKGGTIYKQ
ncbi:MAG TPA: amidohydrolase family protein [Gemmatimonadaceae bacterium]|nr:amidohydrolase family protein [Gemmatimonadaceae bacterium]